MHITPVLFGARREPNPRSAGDTPLRRITAPDEMGERAHER
jgi:hypothetical protein